MPIYAATIFVAAFLLFLVQPVIAKLILPWFGGSAAVWITCLVFFQTALLAGYLYSDLVVRRLAIRTQVIVHATLLVASLAALPIVPAAHWKPGGSEDPSLRILAMLVATIGLPYFLLSTTSPIVQSWVVASRAGARPYRLFALSNLASMLALLGYPFALESWVATRTQALGWSVAYAVFVVLCIVSGVLRLSKASRPPEVAAPQAARARRSRKSKRKVAAVPPAAIVVDEDIAPRIADEALWAILAATGSLLLLSVTNHVTQNVASVPLLWIVPLAFYLLSFIVCFDGMGWYRRGVFLPLLAVALPATGWALVDRSLKLELRVQIVLFSLGLFVACMFCHGELARLKPAPKYLTRFYLMIALGGAAGSVLVGVVAPIVLPAYFEFAGALIVVALLALWQLRRAHLGVRVLAVVVTVATIGCAIASVVQFYDGTLAATRNFYGVLRVRTSGPGESYALSLIHGNIRHGTQYSNAPRYPTTYYVPTSGVGRLLAYRPNRPYRVGVVGLGVGTLATYAVQGDVIRFYEIDPDVLKVAQRDFSFLRDSLGNIEYVMGDARLALEREPDQQFDVLVVDAFFGDAIPVHLLTSEAMAIYLRHLKPGGVIALHVTNRFVNLIPVAGALAEAHRLNAIHVQDRTTSEPAYPSDWVLMSERRESLERPKLAEVAKPVLIRRDWPLWTDDFNNVVRTLR